MVASRHSLPPPGEWRRGRPRAGRRSGGPVDPRRLGLLIIEY